MSPRQYAYLLKLVRERQGCGYSVEDIDNLHAEGMSTAEVSRLIGKIRLYPQRGPA